MEKARARLDSLAKPPGSLGRLEDIVVTLAGISREMFYNTSKRCVIIMASDNGVVEEGVASAPQAVTYAQTLNFTKGITGISVLAKQFNAGLIIVDIGVNAEISHPLIKNRKIRKATWNIAQSAAMTRDEAERAILVGIETAIETVKDYMFASHASFEQGFAYAAQALGLEPCLNLNMRPGEGSGCPLMFAMIDAACAVMRNMSTFEQAAIGDEYLNELKDGDNFTVGG